MRIFFFSLLVWTFSLTGCHMSSSFDAALWRAQNGSQSADNPRAGQIEALEKHHLRKGMARAQVHELLGEPDLKTRDSDRYFLGVAPMGIDPEEYVITYDASDRVSSFKVVRR